MEIEPEWLSIADSLTRYLYRLFFLPTGTPNRLSPGTITPAKKSNCGALSSKPMSLRKQLPQVIKGGLVLTN